MNGYTRATQLGKVTLEQLSNSMGPILPLAKNIGISFADVAGAMSTMTNAGIPANVAATSLRFLMQSLENPTLKARNAMTAMGLSSVAVGNEMKMSLPGGFRYDLQGGTESGPRGVSTIQPRHE
jgi:TP901 family phage tail tape measure protein